MDDHPTSLADALVEADAYQARVTFVRTATAAIERISETLRGTTRETGNELAAGVALALATGASLAHGTCVLLDAGEAYSAAALLRQIVEVEYLLWTFGDDSSDAARWLRGQQLESRFRPAAMRKRSNGVFRSEEYRVHCKTGGHPTPTGAAMLLGWKRAVPALWADLGQHLEHIIGLVVSASEVAGVPEVIDPVADEVFESLNGWRESDPWAFREPFPTD